MQCCSALTAHGLSKEQHPHILPNVNEDLYLVLNFNRDWGYGGHKICSVVILSLHSQFTGKSDFLNTCSVQSPVLECCPGDTKIDTILVLKETESVRTDKTSSQMATMQYRNSVVSHRCRKTRFLSYSQIQQMLSAAQPLLPAEVRTSIHVTYILLSQAIGPQTTY